MIIKSIKLVNFRNHQTYSLECKNNTTLIIGENGCGKTSVLEAIYILMRGKSFRATDPEIIKKGTEFYRIEINFNNNQTNVVTYDRKNKTYLISGKKSKRLTSKDKHPIILFLPSDLNLTSYSPSRRRDYFDQVFSQLSEEYHVDLLKYNKTLRQRNELLKKEFLSQQETFSWNIILSKYGSKIHHFRQNFINQINSKLTNTYRSIADNQDNIEILYQSEATDNQNNYFARLEANFSKDSITKHTNFGIHRDDYIFHFNHNKADGSASRGESRSIILALKFIEAELIYQQHNQKPIILLDDVFSELDAARRKSLVKNFQDNQIIITSVEDITGLI